MSIHSRAECWHWHAETWRLGGTDTKESAAVAKNKWLVGVPSERAAQAKIERPPGINEMEISEDKR